MTPTDATGSICITTTKVGGTVGRGGGSALARSALGRAGSLPAVDDEDQAGGRPLRPAVAGDWLATGARLTAFSVAVVVAAVLRWWWLFALVVVGGLAWLVTWHARAFGYRCPACGHEFTVGPVRDLLSLQGITARGGTKHLRCPSCGERSWCEVLGRTDR